MARHHSNSGSESLTNLLVPPDNWGEDLLGERQYRALKLAQLLTEFAEHGLREPQRRQCAYLWDGIFGSGRMPEEW